MIVSKVIESTTDNDRRKAKVVRYGSNDNSVNTVATAFGEDANVPKNVRALYTDTANSGKGMIVGFISPLIEDLEKGEKICFSTSANGAEKKAYTIYRQNGDIELNGDADTAVGFAELKKAFDALVTDFNNLVIAYNTHTHVVDPSTFIAAITPAQGSSSTASVDNAEKAQIKMQ